MRTTFQTNDNLQRRPTDPDHCFFLRKSGLWLHRILGRFPRIDDATVTLLEEVLGEEAFAVAEELLQNELGDACSLPGEPSRRVRQVSSTHRNRRMGRMGEGGKGMPGGRW